jgi:hypothetical protein
MENPQHKTGSGSGASHCSEFEFATVAGRGNQQSRGCPPKSVTAGETAHSMYPNGECPNCGGRLHGNGYNTVLHCENAEDDAYWYVEPDARPVYCIPNTQMSRTATKDNL